MVKLINFSQFFAQNRSFCSWKNIRPLCLPDPSRVADTKGDIEATVAGWGLTGKGQSTVLQKAKLLTTTNEECAEAYRKTGSSLEPSQICAYKEGSDACQGDSGGALFAKRPTYLRRDNLERMEIIGITSFGQKCALSDKPGGYTRYEGQTKFQGLFRAFYHFFKSNSDPFRAFLDNF